MEMMSIKEYKTITKKRKYNNRKVTIDGHVFDSGKEGERYLVLREGLKHGEIGQLEIHPVFTLIKSGTNEFGQKYGQATYRPDFTYVDYIKNIKVAEDVKGFSTDIYRLKRKLFMAKYPDYLFVEVK